MFSLAANSQSQDEILVAIDTDTGAFTKPRELNNVAVGLSVSPSGQFMSRLTAKSVVVESLPNFEPVAEVPLRAVVGRDHQSLVSRSSCWSDDDSLVCAIFARLNFDPENGAVRSADPCEVAIVDVGKSKPVSLGTFAGALAATFVDGASRIAIGEHDGTAVVKFCSVEDLKVQETWSLGTDQRIASLAENRSRNILAVATGHIRETSGRIWLWDLKRSELLANFKVPDQTIYDLKWSDDGTKLFIAGMDLTTIDFTKVGGLIDSYVGE